MRRSTPECRWFSGRSFSLFSLEGRRTGRGLSEQPAGGRAAGCGRAFLRSSVPGAGRGFAVRAAASLGPAGSRDRGGLCCGAAGRAEAVVAVAAAAATAARDVAAW